MTPVNMDAMLALEDGTVIYGEGFGAKVNALGELVFATPFTGYEEALTDPSYNGQILMMTYPLIGNYGVNRKNFQSSRVQVEGFVVREACYEPSHHDVEMAVDELLKKFEVPGICEVDTRMLTIKTRKFGTMKAALIREKMSEEEAVELARNQPDISELDLISEVSAKEPYRIEGKGKRVVVVDLGVKKNILNNLAKRDFDVVVVPHDYSKSEIESFTPDAILFSNGPGDPKTAKNAIELAKKFIGELPVFGICFGHQIIGLALGGDTYKLKFGHRGGNQPVKDFESGKVFITSQNHGFAVDPDSVEGTDLKVVQINTNDGTVEAMKSDYLNVMSVQYHPEGKPGPYDTEFFFDVIRKKLED